MSEVYMLKSVDGRTPPCGTPFFNWRWVNVVFLNVVSNGLLMSNATVTVRSGGSFWLNPVASVLLMQCSAVYVECLLLHPCAECCL